MLETFTTVQFPAEAVQFREAILFARDFEFDEAQFTSQPELAPNVSLGLVTWLNADFERHKRILDNYATRIAPTLNVHDSHGISPEELGVNFIDPVKEVTSSFASLFAAMQNRTLVPSEELRRLSQIAAARLGERVKDVEGWANKLSSDTRGADD